jgi:uncharacterized repeat protein (TIGR03803 family)
MCRASSFTARNFALITIFASWLVAATLSGAHAGTFSTVYNFTGGNDGANPVTGLMVNARGDFFGTASSGGASGLGVVFQFAANGTETVLHSFAGGADGATPNGGVIQNKKGDLFGTTTSGGASGAGTVYSVVGTTETVLYSFAGGPEDGADPQAGLIMDSAGNLYGTTSAGGTSGNGTVFELIAPQTANGQWTETVLYSFGTGTDGATPVGGLIFDKAGNLYGTTSLGGIAGDGTVFQLKPGTPWTENILYNFQNGQDGSTPYAGLISDTKGNLYGAATDGGTNGGGTVFELSPSNGSWNFSVLTSIPGWGISGTFRDLMREGSGTIYATTHCDGANNAGTIYKLTPSRSGWSYTLLYTFTGGSDGLYSISNLVLRGGKLYGTTIDGGSDNAGTIYALMP